MNQEFPSYSEIKDIRPANGEIFLSNTKGEPNPVHDGLKIIFLLFRHKLFILSSVVLALVSSVVYSLMMPNWYASTVSIVPPKRATSALEGTLGNISSALKDIGMTKIGGGKSEGYTYMVVLNSRRLKDTLIQRFNLAELYDIPSELHDKLRKELEDNIEFSYEPDGNYNITTWHKDKNKAAEMANSVVQIANTITKEIDQAEAVTSRRYLEQRIEQTDSALKSVSDSLKLFTRETYLFSPQDQAKSASTAVAEIKAELMQQEVILNILNTSYGSDAPATLRQRDLVSTLRSQISNIETKKGFVGNFALKDASEVGARYMRFYTEFETFSKLKALLLPMLEQAKLDERRIATTMYVIDPAVPADKKDRPKRSLIVLGAVLAALVFSMLFVILRYRYYSLKAKYHEVYLTLRN